MKRPRLVILRMIEKINDAIIKIEDVNSHHNPNDFSTL
jgi:hypothetical protein